MCKYCEPNRRTKSCKDMSANNSYDVVRIVEIDESFCGCDDLCKGGYTILSNESFTLEINYCPMCGRKLEEK